MPACLRTHDPAYLCDLMDGLAGIPESQLRARLIEEQPPEATQTGLGYLGFSQDSAILLRIANLLDVLRVQQARMMGDGKTGTDQLPPPGGEKPKPRVVEASYDNAAAFFGRM